MGWVLHYVIIVDFIMNLATFGKETPYEFQVIFKSELVYKYDLPWKIAIFIDWCFNQIWLFMCFMTCWYWIPTTFLDLVLSGRWLFQYSLSFPSKRGSYIYSQWLVEYMLIFILQSSNYYLFLKLIYIEIVDWFVSLHLYISLSPTLWLGLFVLERSGWGV